MITHALHLISEASRLLCVRIGLSILIIATAASILLQDTHGLGVEFVLAHIALVTASLGVIFTILLLIANRFGAVTSKVAITLLLSSFIVTLSIAHGFYFVGLSYWQQPLTMKIFVVYIKRSRVPT